MLTFISSMLCTSKTHPFSVRNYLGTSLIIGNSMRIRFTSVVKLSDAKLHASLLSSSFLLKNSLYFGVHRFVISGSALKVKTRNHASAYFGPPYVCTKKSSQNYKNEVVKHNLKFLVV